MNMQPKRLSNRRRRRSEQPL